MIEQIEEHKGLQDLAQVGWAHQTSDGPVLQATGTVHDCPPRARRNGLAKARVIGVPH